MDNGERIEQVDRSIYRFKLSPHIIELLTNFSRLHMYSSREVFKDKWKEWLIINREVVDIEKKRLKDLGCTKNIDEKMYTATRYYFKKKEAKETKETNATKTTTATTATTTKRSGYVVLDHELVAKMDSYIKESYCKEFKPSTSYTIFMDLNKDKIDREVERLLKIEIGKLDTRDKCREKIKKTFKNRCFVLEKNCI